MCIFKAVECGVVVFPKMTSLGAEMLFFSTKKFDSIEKCKNISKSSFGCLTCKRFIGGGVTFSIFLHK